MINRISIHYRKRSKAIDRMSFISRLQSIMKKHLLATNQLAVETTPNLYNVSPPRIETWAAKIEARWFTCIFWCSICFAKTLNRSCWRVWSALEARIKIGIRGRSDWQAQITNSSLSGVKPVLKSMFYSTEAIRWIKVTSRKKKFPLRIETWRVVARSAVLQNSA